MGDFPSGRISSLDDGSGSARVGPRDVSERRCMRAAHLRVTTLDVYLVLRLSRRSKDIVTALRRERRLISVG